MKRHLPASRLGMAVRETVQKHGMIAKGDTVVCAVSGGADSSVMLHIMDSMKHELDLEIIVAHINHNLRGRESARDMAFVRALSSRLGLKFAGKTLKKGELKGGSLQDAARARRYEFLQKTAARRGAARIAVGHTLDDNAETVLMRFIKGSGAHGLAGIPPKRGMIIRPLIESTRGAIEGFAKANSVDFVTDSSNLSDKYLRNDLRRRLLPLIKKRYNPHIAETLDRESRIFGLDEDYISGVAERALMQTVVERKKSAFMLDRLKLRSVHPAVLARCYFRIMEEMTGLQGSQQSHVEAFIRLVRGPKPNAGFHVHGVWVFREYDRVVFSAKERPRQRAFSARLPVPGAVELPSIGGTLRATLLETPPDFSTMIDSSACFDYDEVLGACRGKGLRVRPMKPGDRIVPLGMKGHKKVKGIFIDEKLPRSGRGAVPLLVAGGEILWVAGIRSSELFKVKASTKRVLRVDFEKGP